MNRERYIKTNNAVKFISSFGEIKMITTVFGVIDMHVEDSSNGSIVYIEESGQIKKQPSISDVIRLGDTSKQKEWQSFVLRNVRIHINYMKEELSKWIDVEGEVEGNKIIKLIDESRIQFNESFSRQNIESKIFSYNKKIQTSKVDGKESLELHDHTGVYVELLDSILEHFEYQTKILQKQFKVRSYQLSKEKQEVIKEEVIVSHRLRWNSREGNFESYFSYLVQNGTIVANTGDHSKEEIMNVLKMVFEEVLPTESSRDIYDSNGLLTLEKEPFEIPFKLKWTKGRTVFKREISTQVNKPKTIFIEQFVNKERGEIPSIANILMEFLVMLYEDKSGVWKKSTLITYLNSPEEFDR